MLTASSSELGGFGKVKDKAGRDLLGLNRKRGRERDRHREGQRQLSNINGLQGSPWAWFSTDGGLGERVRQPQAASSTTSGLAVIMSRLPYTHCLAMYG